jgi:hypothetical protein
MTFLYLVWYVILIVGAWKVFTKAGEAGWKSIIPFYNFYILSKVSGKPGWYLILWLFPILAIIPGIALARAFGRGTGFGVGLGLLYGIFMVILGFGPDQYRGPRASEQPAF